VSGGRSGQWAVDGVLSWERHDRMGPFARQGEPTRRGAEIAKQIKELDETRNRHLLYSPASAGKTGRVMACGHGVLLSYALLKENEHEHQTAARNGLGDNCTGSPRRRRLSPNRIEGRARGCLETRRPEGRRLHEGQAPRNARTGRPGADEERFAVGHYMDVRQARPRRAIRQWRLLCGRPGCSRQD